MRIFNRLLKEIRNYMTRRLIYDTQSSVIYDFNDFSNAYFSLCVNIERINRINKGPSMDMIRFEKQNLMKSFKFID